MHSSSLSLWLVLPLVSAAIIDYQFPCNSSSKPVRFNISVSQALIEEAITKAGLYRPSADLKDDSNKNWVEGPPRAEMVSLAAHWATNYNWSKVQDEMNSNFSHYALTVPSGAGYNHSVPLHFVHEVSSSSDAIPLLLLHGWPSTHLEWSEIIEPLVSPKNSTDQHFHIVAPDLPGFGFSPAPEYAGLGAKQMGYAFDNLMHALGYDQYGIISTDLGYLTAMWMTGIVQESVIGHFTDFWIQQPNATDLERLANNQTTMEETTYIAASMAWSQSHSGYSTIQAGAPLAIGQVMTDSPVGFAGWIWHLIHAISDGKEYTYDEVITRTLLLWIQGTWGNLRSYREFFHPDTTNFPRTNVPTGCSQWSNTRGPFPEIANLQLAPRSWVERLVNLVYFKRHDAGGHFPAESLPELYVEDVREFFSSL